jgi:Cu2+-exporting ATPase
MPTCTLCDLETPDPPVTDDGVEGTFCCQGCLAVARTLDDVENTSPEDARASVRGDEPNEAPDECSETFVRVSGMHCSTCEAFLEGRAHGHEGVVEADASYTTGLMRLVYDPETVDPDDLPAVLDGTGYEVSDGDDPDEETRSSSGRLLVGGFFGMMTMLWYVLFLYPAYLGLSPDVLFVDLGGPAGQYLLWNTWVMATVVLGYTGFPVLRGAYVSLKAGYPNMDLLVGLAAVTAYLYSTLAILLGHTEVYFDVAIVVVLAVTVGDHYETKIKHRATDALTELTRERVADATRRTDDGIETVQVEELAAGDEVIVNPGERVPIDGTVVEGTAAVDEALVTGESRPVRKEPGAQVVGGSTVTDGTLVVAVSEDETSTLDRLVTTLWEIQSTTPGAQQLANRLAGVFVPIVILLAVLATFGHLLSGVSATDALLTGLAVLVVSCPCALGLATPLAIASGIREALDRGIVVTDGSVFERTPDVETVVFDKTGTLSTGEMHLVDVVEAEADRATLLERAAALEQFGDHPLAAAVTDAAPPMRADVTDLERHPGLGLSGEVDGTHVVVGQASLVREFGIAVPEGLEATASDARARGQVPSFVAWDDQVQGVLVTEDEPRADWEAVVSALAERGIEVVLLTGDEESAAERYGGHPAISEVFAGVPPEAKAEVVERLAAEGPTAMVGDGSNDAPALGTAAVGIALAEGTKLAADAADVVVTADRLSVVPDVFDLTASTNRRIRQNLGWAFCYNAIALPLALAGALNPLFAALAMAASSLLVVANSARSLGVTDERAAGQEQSQTARAAPISTAD